MEKEETYGWRIETEIDGRIQELIRKYDPGLVFEEWVNEFKSGFKACEWSSETVTDQTMGESLFWIECLLKTWREEIGPSGEPKGVPGKQDPFPTRIPSLAGVFPVKL